jgi:hypothetical protein
VDRAARGDTDPGPELPPLRITRLRGTAYSDGIETVTDHGAPIRVYSAAKTVTDCFKFRNKIGLDVALEALKDAWRSRKVTMAELSHFAKINRVERVMQPYLEAVTQCTGPNLSARAVFSILQPLRVNTC